VVLVSGSRFACCRSRRTRGPPGQASSYRAIDGWGLYARTPARSLLELVLPTMGARVQVGSRESANPVGTVATIFVLSPRLYWGIRWSRDASSERKSDAAREARTALNWRRRLSGKGHDAGIRRRASESGRRSGVTTVSSLSPSSEALHPDACADESCFVPDGRGATPWS
jgi:hypothetical protein